MNDIFEKAICWNSPTTNNDIPKRTSECNDHPVVRGTSYMEISKLLGTSGCSKEYPWWTWDVMGVIETSKGKMIVSPGDWIIEVLPNHYVVLSDEEYRKLKQNETMQAIAGM